MRPTSITAAPADPARALGAYIAITNGSLPVTQRYGLAAPLLVAALLAIVGFVTSGPFGALLWISALGIALAVLLPSRKGGHLGFSEGRMIHEWHRWHRSIGLTRVLGPIALELEATAREWERILHVLAASTWNHHTDLRARAITFADRVMMRAITESDRTQRDPTSSRIQLADFADRLERLARDLSAYPRLDDAEADSPLAAGLDSYDAVLQALER